MVTKGRKGRRSQSRESNRRSNDEARARVESEWEEKIIQVSRVTKVVKGGKKMSFRAVVAVGNGKGQVGVGVGKAAEVVGAIQKGVVDAKKSLIAVPLVGTTIPHQIIGKQGSSRIMLKPAAKGTGIIAGGAARSILELSGVQDVLAKSLGSRSPLNVARATIDGFGKFAYLRRSFTLTWNYPETNVCLKTIEIICKGGISCPDKKISKKYGCLRKKIIMSTSNIKVTLTSGLVGKTEKQIKVVRALGLRKFGSSAIHNDSAIIRGMINKISHMLSVAPASEKKAAKTKSKTVDKATKEVQAES